MHDYRQLRVYDMAIDITSETYRLTNTFPRSERYGPVQQMNRASVSIASNIAEGAGRGDNRDFARFLRIARGSACELEAQATMAARVGVVDGESAPVLREHLEKLKASLTNLEKRMSRP
jgi:four helix bundle protein